MSELFQRAQRVIPGGVNSPVRAYKGMGLDPIFIDSARGCRVVDRDKKPYVDYVLSYGPHILGHRHPAVEAAIEEALRKGTSFGAPTEREVRFAEMICDAVPSVEMVRLVNSGTEAAMSALRLARAATGRERIIKFEGCYHGHADGFLVQAGSGALTLGHPTSPGVPRSTAELTSVARFNDLDSVERLLESRPGEYAGVFVEAIAGNMGCIAGTEEFLRGLRELCDDHGTLLVFDEVMTGFRVALGGAQERFGITPDLTALGKIIGGGLPVGAYGGRREVMEMIAPVGPVYQAGTLSGNPLAVAAGIATLEEISKPGFYEALERSSAAIEAAILGAAEEAGCPITMNRVGSMFCPYFLEGRVGNFDDVMAADRDRHRRFFVTLLEHGVMPAPSPFEAWFSSSAHDEEAIETTRRACGAAFRAAVQA